MTYTEDLRLQCIRDIYIMLLKYNGRVLRASKWDGKYIFEIRYERGMAKRAAWPKGEN